MLFITIITLLYFLSNIDSKLNQILVSRIIIFSSFWLILLISNHYISCNPWSIMDLPLYSGMFHFSPLLLTWISVLSIIGFILLFMNGFQIYDHIIDRYWSLQKLIINTINNNYNSNNNNNISSIINHQYNQTFYSNDRYNMNYISYPYNYITSSSIDIPDSSLKSIPFPENSKNNYYLSLSSCNEYSFLLLVNILSFFLLISSMDLLSIIISIELVSFNLYIITNKFSVNKKDTLSKENNFLKNRNNSNNISSWNHTKSESVINSTILYYLYSSIGSSIIILGSILIYIFYGSMNFDNIFMSWTTYATTNILTNNESLYIYISFLFLLFGLFLKSGVAPFHIWSPYVYSNNYMPTISWLYIITKLGVLPIILFLLYYVNSMNSSTIFDEVLLSENNSLSSIIEQSNNIVVENIRYGIGIIAIINLVIGSMSAILETNIVRLFVYSSISHIGFILLCCVNFDNYNSMVAAVFYIIQNSISSCTIIFMIYIISNSRSRYLRKDTFAETYHLSIVKGYSSINKYISYCFLINLLSLLGIPPMIGFYGKLNLLYSLSNNNYYLLMLLAILISVITSIYYLYIMELIMISNTKSLSHNNTRNNQEENTISKSSYIIITLLTSVQLLYIFSSDLINNHIEMSIYYLYN